MDKPLTPRIALAAVLMVLTGGLGSAQTPDDWSPYVGLGYEIAVTTFAGPRVESDSTIKFTEVLEKKVIRTGISGSGTIISQDGLILTNYHVAVFEDLFSFDEQRGVGVSAKLANDEILVYQIANNDPLEPATLKYWAKVDVKHKNFDIAVLRIVKRADGTPVSGLNFRPTPLGNPYGIALRDDLTIVGYPGKGGATVTVTDGKFLGYTVGIEHVRDGAIKADATIAGGNSGGSALHNGRLVGVPTQVSPKGQKGFDFGYLHPVTWAAEALSFTRMRNNNSAPDIPKDWLESKYNKERTGNGTAVGGFVHSNSTGKAIVGAQLTFFRPDRTIDQIRALASEVASLKASGNTARATGDAARYLKGEFFYRSFKTVKSDGFYWEMLPKSTTFSVRVSKKGYRPVTGNITTGDGFYFQITPIRMTAL